MRHIYEKWTNFSFDITIMLVLLWRKYVPVERVQVLSLNLTNISKPCLILHFLFLTSHKSKLYLLSWHAVYNKEMLS